MIWKLLIEKLFTNLTQQEVGRPSYTDENDEIVRTAITQESRLRCKVKDWVV